MRRGFFRKRSQTLQGGLEEGPKTLAVGGRSVSSRNVTSSKPSADFESYMHESFSLTLQVSQEQLTGLTAWCWGRSSDGPYFDPLAVMDMITSVAFWKAASRSVMSWRRAMYWKSL
jgi:hypothetical protein